MFPKIPACSPIFYPMGNTQTQSWRGLQRGVPHVPQNRDIPPVFLENKKKIFVELLKPASRLAFRDSGPSSINFALIHKKNFGEHPKPQAVVDNSSHGLPAQRRSRAGSSCRQIDGSFSGNRGTPEP
jgi:hypothetical protein